jgi:hypothetical protein
MFSFVLLLTAQGASAATPECPGDVDQDGEVTVDEILLAVNAALFGCTGEPGPQQAALLQTGQTRCDQGDGTLGMCPGSPAGQDGAVLAGVPAVYTDNEDGTITNTATGLMWEKLSNDGSVHDQDKRYTWSGAFEQKIAALNTSPCFAGHCDWRLPNLRELESLLNVGEIAPAVDPVFNSDCTPGCTVEACSCTQLDFYWASTTFEDLPDSAWAVDLNLGFVNGFEKVLDFPVRAVRGGL